MINQIDRSKFALITSIWNNALRFDKSLIEIKHKKLSLLGHGRKRRAIDHDKNATIEYTKFKENLQYTVLMPGEMSNDIKYRESSEQCRNFVVISGLLAGLLALSTIIVSFSSDSGSHKILMKFFINQTCGLASKLQSSGRKSLDDFANNGYAGRAVMQ